jgi:hypothetical protein
MFSDPRILNIYRFGSHVYGTNNEKSDKDFILVTTTDKPEQTNPDIHIYTHIEFQQMLDSHDIQALECYFSDFATIQNKQDFNFELDRGKLRVSISTVSNGSWVKGKKKLTVMYDYDKYLALKSLFHSIRILDYGIQIASHGKIVDYKKYNWFLEDLLELGNKYEHTELWEKIDNKYREFRNKMSTEFKALCPKTLLASNKTHDKLVELFKDHGCYSQEVIKTNLIKKIIKLCNEN